jgi:hypothetical protein
MTDFVRLKNWVIKKDAINRASIINNEITVFGDDIKKIFAFDTEEEAEKAFTYFCMELMS